MQKTKRKKPLAGFTLDADYSRIANISIARPRGAGAVRRIYSRILNRSPASVNAPGTSTSWPMRQAAQVVLGVSLAVTGLHGDG